MNCLYDICNLGMLSVIFFFPLFLSFNNFNCVLGNQKGGEWGSRDNDWVIASVKYREIEGEGVHKHNS
jgi:hypothetical protein